ncbi:MULTISPECIES: hypothetical protein [unclassified Mesorhizobium]|uniref:hypothetical protein n=1 Tax=unclassified Mesorhizobium TaxID=325217 RepID=UPI001483A3FB|nr:MULTISPECIES: hypothetical protein [unclassified Mesorhizobium]
MDESRFFMRIVLRHRHCDRVKEVARRKLPVSGFGRWKPPRPVSAGAVLKDQDRSLD